MVKTLLEECINPLVETRPSEKAIQFKFAHSHRKILGGLIHEINNVFALLSQLIASEDVPETAITTLEFLAKDIIFIDNSAHEKDSALGTQKVERLRVAAMDILAKVISILVVMIKYADPFRSSHVMKTSELLSSTKFLPV